MTSTQQKYLPALYGALGLLMAVPFLADLFLPLGTAIWVLYIFPVALAYLAPRPIVPPVLAALATLFMVVGFNLAPVGVAEDIASLNRALGSVTAWIVGGIGYLFIKGRRAIKREEWLQAGHVGLAAAMGGDQKPAELADNILSYLADYLGARAGTLFVRGEDRYDLKGRYAVPAGAAIPAQLDASDGVAGLAIRTGRSVAIADVPDDYLYYGSSLGQAKPNRLIVAPALADGEVGAVIELGFSGAPNQRETELLDRVSESVAIAVRSARYRERLQELLEETQQQAEELQAQSEELRATNEELEQQSKSLQDSQARLEEQQAELEQTNSHLEDQAQTLERQRDDLRRAQSELETQASELERASRYKSEFLANMSHELRTPLNSLLIMARLLADNRDGNLNGDQVRFAETIEASGNDLLLLINDILDISKIEAGKLDLQPRRIRVGPMADKLRTMFDGAAAQKGLSFKVEVDASAPKTIETDPQRIEQILKNFLSNAVKFTEKGEVSLTISGGKDTIALSVSDSGIGIAEDQQDAIFEAFRQADGSISRKYGGTGLGLSICRELARLLGGGIQVESTLGAGSTFSLIVPVTYTGPLKEEDRSRVAIPLQRIGGNDSQLLVTKDPASPPPITATINPIADDRESLAGDKRTLLVIEDDPAFASILRDLAHEKGFQCLIAGTADEGVLLARQYLPSAVILDMELPDHSGMSVLERIKRDVKTRHIPVHIVSVNDQTHAAMSYGAVGYALKPIKLDKLSGVLERLEGHLSQRVRRILVVEDDATQRESLRHLLGSRDIETVDARSAAECLAKLETETFDCMVLDLNLPDSSGFDVLKTLSEDEKLSFPPAIVYTGRDLSADEELQLRKYSKSIIVKGARSPERLLDEVTLFLHQVVADLPDQHQRMINKSLNRDAALEGRHILVVEDDIRNVYALTSLFEPHGATVRIARNGREAITALETAKAEGRGIDLVLMDVMMPEMDGLTATREIRGRPEWQDLPIITLTAKATSADHEECITAGANDYLSKPLDVDKLLSLARVWMPR